VSWAYEYLGDTEEDDHEAESRYRDAITCYQRIPGVRGNAEVKLAILIARTKQRSKYPEAEALLDSYRPLMKIHHFWVHLARARIAADLGEVAEAGTHARLALAEYADEKPQFRRHPEVGHVRTDDATLAELRSLARNT
jgi:hypothetical protein